MSEQEILAEKRGACGVITLNRPKALNALTLGMVDAMHATLRAWAEDLSVTSVVVRGTGDRAFCAGGDIRALYDSGKAGTSYVLEFYEREYRLNAYIKHFPKPYVALIHGIVMGGGVGVSVHGSHRVACETTIFAMPETGIGLFPDVGGTYFLPRCPGEIGTYLALTGARIKAADMIHAGLADVHVPFASFQAVIDGFAAGDRPDAVIGGLAIAAGEAPLAGRRPEIDRYFAGDRVEDILANLDARGSAFATDAAKTMRQKSPTSLKITLRQMREGRKLSFDDAMRLEFRMTSRVMAGRDFYEGVRAVVIDKDQAPKWEPSELGLVSAADVARYFASLGPKELMLP